MTEKIAAWLDAVLVYINIPDAVCAFSFNLYDDCHGRWSLELVGTDRFDPDDEDWACFDIADFGTRNEPLAWQSEADGMEILADVTEAVRHYLEHGRYAAVLKQSRGVGLGFVDGDLEILYQQ